MEPFLAVPQLTDHRAPDDLPVDLDQGTVRLAGHRDLRQPGHHEWIGESRQQRQHDGGAERSYRVLHHVKFTASKSMSITLMPMNGTMIPPSP